MQKTISCPVTRFERTSEGHPHPPRWTVPPLRPAYRAAGRIGRVVSQLAPRGGDELRAGERRPPIRIPTRTSKRGAAPVGCFELPMANLMLG